MFELNKPNEKLTGRVNAKYKLTKNFNDEKFKDADGKLTDEGVKQITSRTLRISFDFADVTVSELVDVFLSTQTTPVKMLYNNELQNWSDKMVLEEVAKGTYNVKVREMLDGRKSRTISDEEKRRRDIKKQIEKGKTIEQIRAEYEAALAELEGGTK